ncbi:NADH dehydrogenase [Methanosarcina sp. A14]|uniref:Glutamine--fructose-6-phosphate aminotransferase (Isomerizing) n=2 Tax=Methanosarcina barkeri TaxID=2208 RepID=A0A0E3QPB0_METBA|nr:MULTISPECIES: FAD-dependent oxidoreductase [Methanosarcina]AKB53039.1 Glutamine--fructose-6-phosphate aminotransferase (isomerizing) [Methanosarcina barkeri MS]OED07764.1 NADH dehydrogenase [Methanosarcina sp. A14]
MGSDFDTKSAVDEIQKTAKADEKFQGTVSTQNLEKKDPIKVVIIGGGACGMAVATKIRRQSDFEITVISRDSHTAYSHCGIPFVLGREIESFEKLIVKPRDFFKRNRIDVKLNEYVSSIDLDLKVVRTGEETYPFDKLVIATGSLPFIPFTGNTNVLPYGIFTLRNLDDGVLFEKALETVERVCIIGAGTIGIECAAALSKRGIKTFLINRSKNLLSKQLDPDISEIIREHLESLGIEVISGKLAAYPENFWKEKTLYVWDRQLPADLILLASGVRPEVSLALEAGIKIGKAGGIIVNEMLQVKAREKFLPYVYAGGECVEIIDLITGEAKLSHLGTTARHMADIIGNNITGKYTPLGPLANPWVAVAGELQFGGVGITSKEAESHGIKINTGFSRGRTRASYYPGRKDLYIKLLFKDDILVGAQLIGGEGIKERIDAFSLAIRKKATIRDLLDLETCYAPPVSMLVDPLRPAVKAAIRNIKEKKEKQIQAK